MTTVEDSRLIGLSRSGSKQAFADLVRRHQARVRGYLGGYVRRADVVDDLAQEVFLAAFRHLDRYDERDAFGLWVLGIARHRALMYLRTELRRHARERRSPDSALDQWQLDLAEAEREDFAARDRELEALASCLQSLPDASHGLVREHYVDDRPLAEIARRRGKQDGALRITMFRIRQALRQCVRQRLAAVTVGR